MTLLYMHMPLYMELNNVVYIQYIVNTCMYIKLYTQLYDFILALLKYMYINFIFNLSIALVQKICVYLLYISYNSLMYNYI